MLSSFLSSRLHEAAHALGYEIIRTRPGADGPHSGEAEILADLVAQIGPKKIAVDIGAYDGYGLSNTLRLFREGWSGLAIEYAPSLFARLAVRYQKFPDVSLARVKVTPDNIVPILAANGIPGDFGFLNLDIDGFDYFVLNRLLEHYRPSVICVEINEKIPPPIKFAVKFSDSYWWDGSEFYGMSLSMLEGAAKGHGYALVELEYNNAFLVPNELSSGVALTAEQAYGAGYKNRPDRLTKFAWNAEMECLQTLSLPEAMRFIREQVKKPASMPLRVSVSRAGMVNGMHVNLNTMLKTSLWKSYGSSSTPAEWDGTIYGGGKLSQRFWEYHQTIEFLELTPASVVLDIGGGSPVGGAGFFARLIAPHVRQVHLMDVNAGEAGEPALPILIHREPATYDSLLTLLRNHPEISHVTSISVLEHISQPERCAMVTALNEAFKGNTFVATLEFHARECYFDRQLTTRTLSEMFGGFTSFYPDSICKSPFWCENAFQRSSLGHRLVRKLGIHSKRIGREPDIPLWYPVAFKFLRVR
jgi:hypothetical protein